MPFAGYENFEDCIRKNQNKEDPKAYCGKIKHQVEDVYVQGYFKPKRKYHAPNINCMKINLAKKLQQYPDLPIQDLLEQTYQFCISETDFRDIIKEDMKVYGLLCKISTKLAEYKQDFYILDDAEVLSSVSPGVSHRIEPMKTLAEAATSGKKKSSNIEKVGYFNNMLEVEFNSGERYIYFVEPDFYDRFVASDSKGKFLWEELRGHEIGLVWGYATGTGSKMKYTPGGVGASLVPYAKGSGGTPEYEPRLPTEAERGLIKKEIQIQMLGQGLKYKEMDPDLKRGETLQELRSIFGSMPKSKKQKKITNPNKLPPHERYIDFEIKEDAMEELIGWVQKEIGAKGDEAVEIAFAISNSRKKKKQNKKKVSKEELSLKQKQKELSVLKQKGGLYKPNELQATPEEIRKKVGEITRLEHIIYKKKKQEKKESPILDEEEYAIANLGAENPKNYLQYKKESKELEWKEIWNEIGEDFKKQREARQRYKEHKKGTETYYKNAYYGTLDFIGIPLKEDYCGSIEDFGVCKKKYELLYDFYHMEDEIERNKLQKTIKKYDINIQDDTTLEGVITRAGAFKYGDKIMQKEWNNLLENAVEYPVLPVFGSKYTNPHEEENIPHLIGYVDSWNPDFDNKELRGKIHTFEPIESLSDIDDPRNIQVSLSMFDDAPEDSNIQHIIGFRNVAIALNNQIQGRCESVDGYGSCMVSPTEDMDISKNIIIKNDAQNTSKMYYCSICKHYHRYDSKKGKEHLKSRDKSKEKGKRKKQMRFLELIGKYMRASANKKKDMNHVNNLSQIIIQKPMNNRSSSSEKRPRKIITQKNDLHMTDENKKIKEEIAKFIEDFKKEEPEQKDDSLAISTGNEVKGHTLKDEFYRTMLDDGWSVPSIDKAWGKYNAQNKQAGGEVDVTTYGFTKTPPSMSGDFDEKLQSLMKIVEKQSESIKKYEDFFQTKQKEVETELKNKYKKPFSEVNQELIEKLDFDTLETIQPIMDLLIKEHPEIMPTDKGAEEISDLNTNEILKMLGKEKESLRKVKDDAVKIKEDAIEKMKEKWSKKGE